MTIFDKIGHFVHCWYLQLHLNEIYKIADILSNKKLFFTGQSKQNDFFIFIFRSKTYIFWIVLT